MVTKITLIKLNGVPGEQRAIRFYRSRDIPAVLEKFCLLMSPWFRTLPNIPITILIEHEEGEIECA